MSTPWLGVRLELLPQCLQTYIPSVRVACNKSEKKMIMGARGCDGRKKKKLRGSANVVCFVSALFAASFEAALTDCESLSK